MGFESPMPSALKLLRGLQVGVGHLLTSHLNTCQSDVTESVTHPSSQFCGGSQDGGQITVYYIHCDET